MVVHNDSYTYLLHPDSWSKQKLPSRQLIKQVNSSCISTAYWGLFFPYTFYDAKPVTCMRNVKILLTFTVALIYPFMLPSLYSFVHPSIPSSTFSNKDLARASMIHTTLRLFGCSQVTKKKRKNKVFDTSLWSCENNSIPKSTNTSMFNYMGGNTWL